MVAEGRADVAVMHLKTSLWDTCAPEAILRSSGAQEISFNFNPLPHTNGTQMLDANLNAKPDR